MKAKKTEEDNKKVHNEYNKKWAKVSVRNWHIYSGKRVGSCAAYQNGFSDGVRTGGQNEYSSN